MRRHGYDPTIDGRILEPRRLMSGTQEPPPYIDPLEPGMAFPDPNPGDSGTPPGDYPPTDPGLC